MNKIRVQEKRKAMRLRTYHLAKYRPLGAGKEYRLAALKDIASGGVSLKTEEPFIIGSILELKINFPPLDIPIATLAKVVWMRQVGRSGHYEAGLQFQGIADSLAGIINERVNLANKALGKRQGLFKCCHLQRSAK